MRSSYPFRAVLASLVLVAVCWTSDGATAGRSASALLRTPHSGWLWSNPTPQGETLEAVEFAGDVGFASGEDGTLLRSLDAGASWTALFSGTTEALSQMQLLGPETVVVGGSLSLRESTDGGATFREIRSQKPCYECTAINSFSFLSPTSGFVETYSGSTKSDALLWTENGGATFQARTPVPLYAAEPGQIRFLSPSDGFALVSGQNVGRVMHTADGGRTWTIAAEGRNRLHALNFATPLIGYAVGEGDTLLRSEDGGATWSPMPLRLPPGVASLNLTGISCADAALCLITTQGAHALDGGPVLRTTDGGATATPVNLRGLAASFVDSGGAVAVGGRGTTAISVDGGAQFADLSREAQISEPYEEPPTRLRLGPSAQQAYLPGTYGRIVATRDGGESWQALQLPTRRTVLDAAFPVRGRGFAIVKAGGIYATNDSGHSWRRCGAAARSPAAVLAPNARVVLVSGDRGVWRSTDACRTFTHLGGTVAAEGGRLRALQSFALLAVGGAQEVNGHTAIFFADEILESSDAGKHWTIIPRPVRAPVEALSFPSARSGYVQEDGTLFFTADRGRHWRRLLTVAPQETHATVNPSISFSGVRDGFITASGGEDQRPNIVFRTEDAGRSWIPEEMPDPIGTILAAPHTAYAASPFGQLFVARGAGYAGAASRIALRIAGASTISRKALAHAHHDVTVRGSITPPVSGARVVVARTGLRGGWTEEATETGAGGRFSFTVDEVESTTWIDAYWTGAPGYRGAATGPVRLTVRR
jgi:photosystem II stability/assembly factor-like uncharacterized protein